MKRIILGLFAVGALAIAVPATVTAADWEHRRYHDDVEHRDFHRELYHRDAHRYPMSWRQHGRLHDELEHDAYHDQLEHRSYHRYYVPRNGHHRYYGYGPFDGGRGIGFSGRGFSIWYGR